MIITVDASRLKEISSVLNAFPDTGVKVMNRVLKRASSLALTEAGRIIPTVYGISQKEVRKALDSKSRKRKIKLITGRAGEGSISVEVIGERGLTITRFKHSPKAPSDKATTAEDPAKKKRRKPRKFKPMVTVFLDKGKKPLGPVTGDDGKPKSVFYAPNSKKADSEKILFYHTGKPNSKGREAMKPVLTVSVPQMIKNPKVEEQLVAKLDDILAKRMIHEMDYALGGLGSNLIKE